MEPVARALLDLRGLVLNSYHTPECRDTIRNKLGEKVPSARYAVDMFIQRYLAPLLDRFAPINIVAVLEGSNQNARRRNIRADYKNRKSKDEEDEVVQAQQNEALTAVQKILAGIGCPLVKAPNCEADDVIALLATKAQGSKVIYTVDHDMMALMSQTVAINCAGEWKTDFKKIDLDTVFPGIVTLYKSLVGDNSDNIKGVPGFGEKTWEGFVEAYGYDGMAGLYEALEEADFDRVKAWAEEYGDPKLQMIYDKRTEWRQSYTLAKLHPEWPETTFAGKRGFLQWHKRLPERSRVATVLKDLDLEKFMDTFDEYFPTFELITADNAAKRRAELVKGCRESEFLPWDYETADVLKHPGFNLAHKKGVYVDLLNSKVTGASFCYGPNFQHTFYVSAWHRDTPNVPQPWIGDFIEAIHEDHDPVMVAHNASFECTITKTNYDIELTEVQDTVIMSSYVNENEEDRLKKLARTVLNYDQATYDSVVPKGKDMRDVSGKEVMSYGCDDSFVTAHLFVLFRLICEIEGTWDFLSENEWAFDAMLLPGFIAGIPIDYTRLSEISAEDDILYEESEKKVRSLLAEHCSEINEDGFETLWDEVGPFVKGDLEFRRAKAEKANADGYLDKKGNPKKLKTDAEIDAKIEAERRKLYRACRYTGQTERDIDFDKTGINQVFKALGLPGLPSLDHDRLEMYVQGIFEQFEDKEPSDQQRNVLLALGACMHELKKAVKNEVAHSPAVLAFQKLLDGVISQSSKLWKGDELNVASPPQMAQLLYGKMGLPIKIRNIQKDKKKVTARTFFDLDGAPSTNEIAILTWMAELDKTDWDYQVLENLINMKRVRQRRSLYYKPYPLWRSPVDGRIHPQHKNCGTITRRPSGRSPNVYQVSKTRDEGKMRSTFLPQDDDSLIVSIDFVQQELVILADYSQDANLLSCYVGDNRRDVHSMTGMAIMNMLGKKDGKKPITYFEFAELADKKGSEPWNIRKKYAKTTNFLIVYGGSAVGLSQKTIVPRSMAEQFVEGFHKTYPGVEKFTNETVRFAKRHGYVTDVFGNRKHCVGLFDKNSNIVNMWERQAVNFKIQGSAASIGKRVASQFVRGNYAERFECVPYAFIYDEVLGSVKKRAIAGYVDAMADIMEMTLPNGTRLRTSVSIGTNWGEQVEIGERPSAKIVEFVVSRLNQGVAANDIQEELKEWSKAA